jgi:hypothetical protein
MTYTLYSNGILEKDGYYLPVDELNPDYQDYLAWLALGNSPTPADASIYLAKLDDDIANISQVRNNYVSTMADLQTIIDAAAPSTQAAFNTWAFNAIKTIARALRALAKFIVRRMM